MFLENEFDFDLEKEEIKYFQSFPFLQKFKYKFRFYNSIYKNVD